MFFPFLGRYKAGGIGGMLWAVLYEIGFMAETPFRRTLLFSNFSDSPLGSAIIMLTNIVILIGGALFCGWLFSGIYASLINRHRDTRPDCIKNAGITDLQWQDHLIRTAMNQDRMKRELELETKIRDRLKKEMFQVSAPCPREDTNGSNCEEVRNNGDQADKDSNETVVKALSMADILKAKPE